MANCNNLGTEEQKNKFLKVLDENKGDTTKTISVLQKTQSIYGFIPEHVLPLIASSLNISVNEVYGIVTFYSQFSLTPKAKYTIDLCLGTACFVSGSKEVLDKVCASLNLKVGELSTDGKFMITTCRCLGCCGLAPAMRINDKIYGKVTVKQVDEILKEYSN